MDDPLVSLLLLPSNRMPEAEVSLRLAFYLLGLPESGPTATVGIDGAHIKVHGNEVFPIEAFLSAYGWSQISQSGKNNWQGVYSKLGKSLFLTTESGICDVVVTVGSRKVRAESKKGPLITKKGSPEFPLIREAIGQLMTVEVVEDSDLLVVAVPLTACFRTLAGRWRSRPLITRTGIHFVLVGRDGTVEGLPAKW